MFWKRWVFVDRLISIELISICIIIAEENRCNVKINTWLLCFYRSKAKNFYIVSIQTEFRISEKSCNWFSQETNNNNKAISRTELMHNMEFWIDGWMLIANAELINIDSEQWYDFHYESFSLFSEFFSFSFVFERELDEMHNKLQFNAASSITIRVFQLWFSLRSLRHQ